MPKRFAIKASVCLAVSALAGASVAHADNGYLPYYEGARDNYQFEVTQAPMTDGVTDPLPPATPVTNWQPPAKVFQQKEAAIMAPTLELGTRSGIDLGLEGSYYNYNEPSPDVKISGPQVGPLASATFVLPSHTFDTLDFRFNYARVDYESPDGTSKDHENTLWEIRDIIGQDFVMGYYDLSPYLGLGFRDLYNDSRGLTTLGYSGYQRDSEYLYIPIGVKPQIRVDGNNIIASSVEFDYLAHGWQTSNLGDTGDGDPTVHNGQDGGFGIRGDMMWQTPTWSFGPYVNYWNLNDSAGKIFTSPNATCGSPTCVLTEPRNITIEGGLQLKYHFPIN